MKWWKSWFGSKKPRPIPHVTVGRGTYGVTKRTAERPTAEAPVSIGNFCSFAPGVLLMAHTDHPTDYPSTFPFRTLIFGPAAHPERRVHPNVDAVTRGPITIGHDVWIGQNAIVLSGRSIGTGAIIGACAVVAHDVPPYAIAVGNPARVVRHRFPPETVERLLACAWWDLPDDALLRLDRYLYSTDIEAFLEAVGRARA